MSHEEAPSPSYFTDTALNSPSALPGMINQIHMAAPIALEEVQLDKHVEGNIPERCQPIAGNSREWGSCYWPGEGSDFYRQTLPDLPYPLSHI